MSTNTASIQSYRKIEPVYRAASPISPVEGPGATVINISEKIDANYTGRQNRPVVESLTCNMPPLVRAYFKGRDNDPL